LFHVDVVEGRFRMRGGFQSNHCISTIKTKFMRCRLHCVLAGNEREKGKKGLLALASERRAA
jgi:hypothetical protein